MNSLLDFRGLARTVSCYPFYYFWKKRVQARAYCFFFFAFQSNSGAACTCVATEYHYRDGDDFVVETDWFDEEEIGQQLAQLLATYRHFHLHSHELDSEDVQSQEEAAKGARDVFAALFQGRLADHDVLITEPEESLLEAMRSMIQRRGLSEIERRRVLAGVLECSDHLTELTSDRPDRHESRSWPLIKRIRCVEPQHVFVTVSC